MKILAVLFFFSTTLITGVAQELEFFEGSVNELRKKAEKEGRPYFVDVYTDWCTYCKKMDKTTFKDPKVVKFLNENFIITKVNAEKGEGTSFAKEYGISGYPSFVVFDSKSEVIGQIEGFTQPDRMLSLLTEMLEANGGSSNKFSAQYTEVLTDMKEGLMELWEGDQYALSYEYGKRRNAFEYDELRFSRKDKLDEHQFNYMEVLYFTGLSKYDEAAEVMDELVEAGELKPELVCFIVLEFIAADRVDVAVLRWINTLNRQHEDVMTLEVKAAAQWAIGDQEDAVETARKVMEKEDADQYGAAKLLLETMEE